MSEFKDTRNSGNTAGGFECVTGCRGIMVVLQHLMLLCHDFMHMQSLKSLKKKIMARLKAEQCELKENPLLIFVHSTMQFTQALRDDFS